MVPSARRFCPGATVLSPAKGRFSIPSDVLASARWSKAVTDITVEIVQAGHVRLHCEPLAQLMTDAAAESNDKGALTETELAEMEQAIADRFHPARFSAKDGNRVTMTQAVIIALVGDGNSVNSMRMFIQAGELVIDVMTNEVRFRRLERWAYT